MELGGKNASIVLDDANLETAAVQCVLGSFSNSGQICMCIDRIIMDRKVAESVQKIFSAVLGKIFSTNNAPPTVVSSKPKERLVKMIEEAKVQGASILDRDWSVIAGSHHLDSKDEQDAFVRPVVVKDTTTEMKVRADEIIGFAVAMTTVESEGAAIGVANSSEYGMVASIFTEDLRRGFRVAKAVEVGQVHINSMTIQNEPAMPFGGVKTSGWG